MVTQQFERIRVTKLAFIHYQHPDLARSVEFFIDFGLVEAERSQTMVFLRGSGSDPYVYVAEQSPDHERHFVGAYYVVASYKSLEDATRLPGASQIESNMGPGGGWAVKVPDPNGFIVGFVFGQQTREFSVADLQLELNPSDSGPNLAEKKYRLGGTRRFAHGPSPVNKLGHYGISTPKHQYASTLAWYMRVLNLKPTDALFDPVTNEELTCFLHIDLGAEYTDHHVST